MKLVLMQLDALRSELADARKRNDALLERLMEKREGPDLLDQVDKILGVRERLGDLGGAESGPRNWKETGMEILRQNAPALMSGINGLLGALSTRSYAPPAPGQPAAANPPTIDVPATPEGNQPVPIPDLSPEENLLRNAFVERGSFVVQKFKAGMTGADFADLFTMLAGEMEYERVRNIGKERILAVVRTIPPMAADIAGLEPQFELFIEEFVTPPSDDQEPEPPAPAKGRAKK